MVKTLQRDQSKFQGYDFTRESPGPFLWDLRNHVKGQTISRPFPTSKCEHEHKLFGTSFRTLPVFVFLSLVRPLRGRPPMHFSCKKLVFEVTLPECFRAQESRALAYFHTRTGQSPDPKSKSLRSFTDDLMHHQHG